MRPGDPARYSSKFLSTKLLFLCNVSPGNELSERSGDWLAAGEGRRTLTGTENELDSTRHLSRRSIFNQRRLQMETLSGGAETRYRRPLPLSENPPKPLTPDRAPIAPEESGRERKAVHL